mmetsp:Transcript_13315/g.32391  ORF Transcript_13315/g.32391 Transcript_13315/m.32391 type:complete len:249 (-) Transcript_13315:1596-2342(-)
MRGKLSHKTLSFLQSFTLLIVTYISSDHPNFQELFPSPRNISASVNKEKLMVGGKGPEVGRALALDVVDNLAHCNHCFQTEDATEFGSFEVIRRCVNSCHRRLEFDHTTLHGGAVHASSFGGGDCVLGDHVAHAANLHLDGPHVSIQQDGPACLTLLLGKDAHGGEELDILWVDELIDGLDSRVDVVEAERVSLCRPFGIVAVAVEDAPEVLLQEVLGHLDSRFTGLDTTGDVGKYLGSHSIEDDVHQ